MEIRRKPNNLMNTYNSVRVSPMGHKLDMNTIFAMKLEVLSTMGKKLSTDEVLKMVDILTLCDFDKVKLEALTQ